MSKSPMYNETECIGKIECPWCGVKFEMADNQDMESLNCTCPECGKEMEVMTDIVYYAYPIDGEDNEVTK